MIQRREKLTVLEKNQSCLEVSETQECILTAQKVCFALGKGKQLSAHSVHRGPKGLVSVTVALTRMRQKMQ